MITINSTKLLMCDIDNTLALWNGEDYYPNSDCIRTIKQFHKRGHTIIAWSAGGAEWATSVVLRFELQDYFSYCMSKPDWYIDDKPSSEFLPEANRIKDKDMWEKELDMRDWAEYHKKQGDK